MMKSIVVAVAYAVMMAELSAAGTFVGQAYMGFSGANGSLPRIPVDVVMTTDYSTLNWTISWDVPETTVVGGPSQTFQTTFGTRGSMSLLQPIKLGLPDSSGTVSSGFSRVWSPNGIEFFGTSRVVTRNETWFVAGSGFDTNDYYISQYLNVANYPTSLKLTASGGPVLSVSTTTTDGNTVTLSGRIYRGASGFDEGIDSLMYEVLPGDFTSNGVVDAADYTVARDTATPMAALLTNLSTWRQSYGGTSIAAASSVPEPTTAAVALLGLSLCVLKQRRA